jgi:hypothetical protein
MVEIHQGIVVQSQSLRSALEDGEHHFEISDNIVSGMSASSTVVLFSVYTVTGEKSDIGDLKLRTNQILGVVLASTWSGSNGCAQARMYRSVQ